MTFSNFFVSVKDKKTVIHSEKFNPLTRVIMIDGYSEDCTSRIFLISNDGYYLSANPNNTLVVDRLKLGPWEKFKIQNLSDGYIALLSAHGKYLSTEINGIVTASADRIGDSQKFKLLTFDSKLLTLAEHKKQVFSKALSNKSSLSDDWFKQAMRLEKKGKLGEAIKCYKLSLEKNPNFSWANYRLARLLLKQEDFTQALEYYQNAINFKYNYSYFHYDLGLLLENMNNYNGAMSSYLKAIELNPGNSRFIEKYRQLCQNKRFFEELMKLNYNSNTEVGNFNLSQTLVNISDSSPKKSKSTDELFYNPTIVRVSLNGDPDRQGKIIYHVDRSVLSSAFFGRVPAMNYLFARVIQNFPDAKGFVRLCFGDAVPENVLVSEENRLLCFSPRKDQHFAVPIPDHVFLSTQDYSKFRDEAEKQWIDWSKRKPCAFWRGSSSGGGIRVNNWQSNHRIKLCNLALECNEPEFLDAKITNITGTSDELLKKTISKAGIFSKRVPQIEFIKYKYVIDIDGNVNSWPGLFTKLLTGSCVLKVDSPYYQWYYDRLEPWVNYIPIKRDLSDLVEKINWCREHDSEVNKIGERGRKLALSITISSELEKTEKVILESFDNFDNFDNCHQLLGIASRPKIDFGIIGFPKCGTTSLYWNLRKHLEICMVSGEQPILQLREQASLLTPNIGQIIGFKTANFIYHNDIISELIGINPNMKMIVCLREPVSWLFSFYKYRRLEIEQNREWLQSNLQNNPILRTITFDQIVYEEANFLGVHKEKGCFVKYLEKLTSLVSPDQILITFLENVKQFPKQEYQRILSFLNLPEDQIELEKLDKHNVNKDKYESKEQYRQQLTSLHEYYSESVHQLNDFLTNNFDLKVPNSFFELSI